MHGRSQRHICRRINLCSAACGPLLHMRGKRTASRYAAENMLPQFIKRSPPDRRTPLLVFTPFRSICSSGTLLVGGGVPFNGGIGRACCVLISAGGCKSKKRCDEQHGEFSLFVCFVRQIFRERQDVFTAAYGLISAFYAAHCGRARRSFPTAKLRAACHLQRVIALIPPLSDASEDWRCLFFFFFLSNAYSWGR